MKLAELPFDFVRKRVSVFLSAPAGIRLITKGTFHQVIALCTQDAAPQAAIGRRVSGRHSSRASLRTEGDHARADC
jgi:magnesium-transporting ATPase (P-type)